MPPYHLLFSVSSNFTFDLIFQVQLDHSVFSQLDWRFPPVKSRSHVDVPEPYELSRALFYRLSPFVFQIRWIVPLE